MTSKGLHVTPRGGKWAVRVSGSERAYQVVSTQKEAIEIAKERARRDGGKLYVHGRDGRIETRSTFAGRAIGAKG